LSPDPNDIEFRPEDELYKRLAPELCKDGLPTSGVYRLNKKPDPAPSLDLARLTTPDKVLSKAPKQGFGLGVLTVADVWELGLTVKYEPELGNDAHCILVAGTAPIDK
jgi:hypothetical protein